VEEEISNNNDVRNKRFVTYAGYLFVLTISKNFDGKIRNSKIKGV
jgi:hypothetical protein